jgi:hypothetical protein
LAIIQSLSEKLRAAAKILLGLRFRREEASLLMPGEMWMKDSDTYLEILEEGAVKEARKLLLLLGRNRFGPPDPTTQAALEAINRPERLEQLVQRLLDVSSWQELLATPRAKRRSRPQNNR